MRAIVIPIESPPAIVAVLPPSAEADSPRAETLAETRRRPAPSLAALPAEAIKGRILNSGQAAQYWGVSLSHWRRLYRAKKVPAPISIGVRKKGWRLSVLDDALAERAEAAK
jgi:predicted DNA-binding transcriptional regulator AlpA